MSASQRVSRGFQMRYLIVAAAVALTGCSDTNADYSTCQVKAYDTFNQSIWKSDDALEYVRLCMIGAGYIMTPVCLQTAKDGGHSLSSVALSSTCFERPWWNGWRRVGS